MTRWIARRVDRQAALLTAAMVLAATAVIFLFGYTQTYNDMIYRLQQHTQSIFRTVEPQLDLQTFQTINTPQDMDKPSYKAAKAYLETAKNMSGLLYLYTAKRADDGSLIYVIDGLDETGDFRRPGDAIEPEIQEDLQLALSGETVLPKEILRTDWGDIVDAYYPVWSADHTQVIGVVGMEYDAGHSYAVYRQLRIMAPLLCLVLCIISVFLSYVLFRRISNPSYKDMANTDIATQLKNSNSFKVDMHNLSLHDNKGNSVISIDLNNLKTVNDQYGHSTGDQYICAISEAIRKAKTEGMTAYRIGGDEFAVLACQVPEEKVKLFIETVKRITEEYGQQIQRPYSAACGYAFFDRAAGDHALVDTYQRADALMYEDKRSSKLSRKI